MSTYYNSKYSYSQFGLGGGLCGPRSGVTEAGFGGGGVGADVAVNVKLAVWGFSTKTDREIGELTDSQCSVSLELVDSGGLTKADFSGIFTSINSSFL